jgi:molybdate transport system substrate-binding protein
MAEIKVMSSAALKPAYLRLAPLFERTSDHTITTLWVLTVDMMTRLKGGEIVDLVIMAANGIDALIDAGKLAPGSRVDLARCGIGAAVRAGEVRPDISSIENFKRALLSAKSIAYSTGPSGVYLSGLFQRLGLADELKPKITQIKGDSIGAVVARGEAEIGFQQVSELLPVAGIDYLGPLPAEIQEITVFSAGLHADATEPDAAKALVKFLTAPEAVAIIKQSGMAPG